MNVLTHPTFDTSTSSAVRPAPLDELLASVFDVANSSSSLLASRHEVRLGTKRYDIPKFLLLGQRGGGKPIRVGLFAGLDAGSIDTTAALTRLLIQHELSPALARDYALFAYPVVNLRGFEESAVSLREFEARYATEDTAPDVQFFRSEIEGWNLDGLITLRTDSAARGFHATTRSELLGREVVSPSLETIANKLPLETNAVVVRPAHRQARLADQAKGKLTAPAGTRPYPFEFEVFAPESLALEQRITGLFLIVQEILRNYRRLISHAQNI